MWSIVLPDSLPSPIFFPVFLSLRRCKTWTYAEAPDLLDCVYRSHVAECRVDWWRCFPYMHSSVCGSAIERLQVHPIGKLEEVKLVEHRNLIS